MGYKAVFVLLQKIIITLRKYTYSNYHRQRNDAADHHKHPDVYTDVKVVLSKCINSIVPVSPTTRNVWICMVRNGAVNPDVEQSRAEEKSNLIL